MKILKTLLKVGFVIIFMLRVMLRDHCHTTRKYRGLADRHCNINVKLNHKIPVVFHNLKNFDSHPIMQELDKFNLKINIIPNGLEKHKFY